VQKIDPIAYAKSRNYGSGAVTYLSPYISRGVISTRGVFESLLKSNLPWEDLEKLIQELAWRDYWQQVWIAQGEAIFEDLKNTQAPIASHKMPRAVLEAQTGIQVVDAAIETLYETGYMHNHMRMYVAAICCNMANCHWLVPAKWMYSHLLDGDLASNHLSWQWVAGAFSNKKYFANQDNINRFFDDEQRSTFLDVDYSAFENISIPEELRASSSPENTYSLPSSTSPPLNPERPCLIYNYYNLDPNWRTEGDFERVLLLEPSLFERYPVDQKCIDLVLALAKNIPEIKVFVGSFAQLQEKVNADIYFKEHPTNQHYKGIEDSRDWMTGVTGYYPSFFKFWKQAKKELKAHFTIS